MRASKLNTLDHKASLVQTTEADTLGRGSGEPVFLMYFWQAPQRVLWPNQPEKAGIPGDKDIAESPHIGRSEMGLEVSGEWVGESSSSQAEGRRQHHLGPGRSTVTGPPHPLYGPANAFLECSHTCASLFLMEEESLFRAMAVLGVVLLIPDCILSAFL